MFLDETGSICETIDSMGWMTRAADHKATRLAVTWIRVVSIWSMSALYIAVGIRHFTDPEFFLNIVPPALPFPLELVYITGAWEVLVGVLLWHPRTRRIAGWGTIILLVVVFPANVYLSMEETPQLALGITSRQALIRLPFQLPLMLLAFWHSRQAHSTRFSVLCALLFFPTIGYFLTL